MRERTCLFLAVMIVAVLGVAMPAVADETVGITTRDSGGNPPTGCPNCPASNPDCCKQRGNPTTETGEIVVVGGGQGCNPVYGPGGYTPFYSCVKDAVVNGSSYTPTPILDPNGDTWGLTIDGHTVPCVGMTEGVPEIGMIELTHSASGKVAKIAKFAVVSGPALGHPPAIYITLNARNFTIWTTGLTEAQINAAVWSAIYSRFVIEDHGSYWIVVRDRQTSASITFISVRADDNQLPAMTLELRPGNGNYDSPCGP